jgi:hypothetical protein
MTSDDTGDEESSLGNPWIKQEYYLEDEEFVNEVFGMAQPIHMWDGPHLRYKELRRDNPHRAYVVAIEHFVYRIVERCKSLSVIDRMLAFGEFPIQNAEVKVSRYEWLRVVLDVLLSRFTSIRDCAYLLVAEVYELGLDPRQVNLSRLSSMIPDASVVDLLQKIGAAGRELRDERNVHLHRGGERDLSDGLDQIFRMLAFYEPAWGPDISLERQDGARQTIERKDLSKLYTSAVEEIRSDFLKEADELMQLLKDLLSTLVPEYVRRWKDKRAVAKDVRDWERDD